MLVYQEVTFLAYSNLFIGFADYQREKFSWAIIFLLKEITVDSVVV